MGRFVRIRSHLDSSSGAAADVLGLVLVCLLILAGFSLPAAL